MLCYSMSWICLTAMCRPGGCLTELEYASGVVLLRGNMAKLQRLFDRLNGSASMVAIPFATAKCKRLLQNMNNSKPCLFTSRKF